MNTLLYDIARCPGVPNLPDDPRAWTGAQGLLVPGTEPGQFVRGKASFDKQHPTVYAQVLAEVITEVANEPPPPAPAQPTLFSGSTT